MKRILGMLIGAVLLTACDSKLEIQPLGKTTLPDTTELETLLNQYYFIGNDKFLHMEMLAGTTYPKWVTVEMALMNKNTLDYAYMAYDESVDRANLTANDAFYEDCYSLIKYFNTVISKAPGSNGDEGLKKQIIAEARVLRAYFHFLLVNTFAAQYEDATAADLGGVPYVDNIIIEEEKTKLSVKEVYDKILEDCSDDVVADMIVKALADPFRVGKDFGYAVRARALFQMKHYEEALKYATAALGVNNTIEDRFANIIADPDWTIPVKSPNNYLFAGIASGYSPCYGMYLSREYVDLIDPMDCMEIAGLWNYDYAPVAAGIDGVAMNTVWQGWVNMMGLRAEQMYFIAAECYIRLGKISQGMAMIDKVLNNRIYYYQPYDASTLTEEKAMKILRDRKCIEMFCGYDNYFDCKRWNSEDKYKRSFTRDLGEFGTYSIAPDSPLWIFPFPQSATNFNASLTQNF